MKRKQIKLMSFIWISWLTWNSRPCPQILLFRKTPTSKFFYAAPPFPLRFSPLFFFPKEPSNRSRNSIPVWRKSQIFSLQLIDDFGPFNVIIWTFGKLQSCSPLSNFPAQLESSWLDIWPESYAKNTNWCVGWNPNPNWTWI